MLLFVHCSHNITSLQEGNRQRKENNLSVLQWSMGEVWKKWGRGGGGVGGGALAGLVYHANCNEVLVD